MEELKKYFLVSVLDYSPSRPRDRQPKRGEVFVLVHEVVPTPWIDERLVKFFELAADAGGMNANIARNGDAGRRLVEEALELQK